MQNAWIWIVALVLLLSGVFLWWQNSQSSEGVASLQPTITAPQTEVPLETTNTASTTTNTPGGGSSAVENVKVAYGASGFSPSTVTIKKGSSVTWTQEGGSDMWVATGPHPAHTGYDGDTTARGTHCAPGYEGPVPFDQCASGNTYTFTFEKVGTWPYHDHMNSSNFGKVVVVE